MNAVIQFFAGLGTWNWLILAVVLFCLETVVPGVHFLWFGAAAVVVGLLTFATAVSWPWQMVAFAGVAIATVFWVRRYARADIAASDQPMLNDRGQQYVGRIVIVEDAIAGGRGKVRVGDTIWQAEGPDLAKGERARIAGAQGTVLRVEREPA